MRRDLRVQEAPENRPSDRGASGAVTPRGKRLGARHPSPTRLHPTHRDGFSPRPRAHAHAFRACSPEPAARLNPPDSASAACPPPRPSSAVGADGSARAHASASVGTAPPTPPPPAASPPSARSPPRPPPHAPPRRPRSRSGAPMGVGRELQPAPTGGGDARPRPHFRAAAAGQSGAPPRLGRGPAQAFPPAGPRPDAPEPRRLRCQPTGLLGSVLFLLSRRPSAAAGSVTDCEGLFFPLGLLYRPKVQ